MPNADSADNDRQGSDRSYGVVVPDNDTGAEGPSDVFLDVPNLHLDELGLEVENLRARVSLQAEVLDLLKLNVGADVQLGRVQLDLTGVDVEAQLKVRLHNVATILARVLQTIDRNPQILEQLTRGVGSAVEEIGSGTGRAVGELGEGAGGAVKDVGRGAGSAVETVGEGAGSAVETVGEGAGTAAAEVGAGAGDAVDAVGSDAGAAAEDIPTAVADRGAGSLADAIGGRVLGLLGKENETSSADEDEDEESAEPGEEDEEEKPPPARRRRRAAPRKDAAGKAPPAKKSAPAKKAARPPAERTAAKKTAAKKTAARKTAPAKKTGGRAGSSAGKAPKSTAGRPRRRS
ncbi:hypothetical protein [Streptomyces sp. SM10]|uniref:hypothetical protein n=1 Tax=Streptomyces sp. SM10 TaxID=565556 RepID=UPI000CD5952A|nr:hypothetical protein [Streptomyces sp. SM10]